MKVLLCETGLPGHRRVYLERLSKIEGIDFFIYAPENPGVEDAYYYKYDERKKINIFVNYFRWIERIRKIVNTNKIDLVHLLDGDSIMRFFGFKLKTLNCNVIITYHHFFKGSLRRISYFLMCHEENCYAVVHTELFKSSLNNCGIKKVFVCGYPSFDFSLINSLDKTTCKKLFGLALDIPVIGIIGSLCEYKNILSFLRILKNVQNEYQLLICGAPEDISEPEINDAIKPYEEKVKKTIRLLTDDEYRKAIMASDIIYCLYGLDFDGASGPLTDGVCAHKMILASNHGALGRITKNNKIGITADVTNDKSVLMVTECALSSFNSFSYCDVAEKYRDSLKPSFFLKEYKDIYFQICN